VAADASGAPSRAASRPAIVFLHATRLTGAQWASQVAVLSGEFATLTPDLPGHGRAAHERFTLETASLRVADVIAGHGSGPVILVGLSLGGYVAMDVAAREPGLVGGLVLAGASVEPGGVRSVPFRGLARVYGSVPEPILRRQQERAFRRRYPAEIADPILAGGFWFRGGADAVRSLVSERFRPRLGAYPGRTLILNGERDLLFRAGERAFVAAARDARRMRIRRAGHRSNLDEPAAFSAAIRRFATEISGSST
jgi:pimeloyl-ACP methyl ester carboxylesterase